MRPSTRLAPTIRPPVPGSPPPPPPPTGTSTNRWGWLVLLALVVPASAILMVRVQQNDRLDQALAELRLLAQARTDLAQGALHLALADGPEGPWRREEGLALLGHAARALQPATGPAGDLASQQALGQQARSLVTALADAPPGGLSASALRLQLGQLEQALSEAAARRTARFNLLRQQQQRLFVGVLVAAGLLLAAAAIGLLGAWRRERQALAALADAHAHQRQRLEQLVDERTAALQQALARQRESEAFARAVVDNVPVPLGYWDRSLRLQFANRGLLRLIGVAPAQAIGQDMTRLLAPDVVATLRPTIDAALAGRSQRLEQQLTRRDGRPRIQWVHFIPDVGADGEPARGLFVAVTDITELRSVQQRLQQLNAELVASRDAAEAANRAKSGFLANISHEIRTPLNAIIGLTHLLRRALADTAHVDRLDKVAAAAQHLLAIISDVLDLSKIEAGKLELDARDFAPDALLQRAIDLVADRARAKGLAIALECPPLPEQLNGDDTRLLQALVNLLGNGVKFTEHGRILLQVQQLASDEQGLLLRLTVHDTGPGVPPAAQAQLFAPFTQADAHVRRQHGGTGLGLAITRRLAEAMGGSVGLDSRPGQGSSFWFTARLRRAGGAQARPRDGTSVRSGLQPAGTAAVGHPVVDAEATESASPLAHSGLKGRHVLLAEDNVVNQEVAVQLLQDLGLSVDVAADGEQAISLASSHDYDLILMDLQMPGTDGLQATGRIRQLAAHRQTPILAMTANALADDRARCLAAGMDDYLSKPVDPALLARKLGHWLATQPPVPAEASRWRPPAQGPGG